MQLRKLSRRVLRASFRCPCVFELVDSEKKKTQKKQIHSWSTSTGEGKVSRRISCRALQEEVRVTVGLPTC